MCSSKRFFHWLLLLGRVLTLPMFVGILTVGEFNLLQYSLHTLNNVFQSGALAVVVREWALSSPCLAPLPLVGRRRGRSEALGLGNGGDGQARIEAGASTALPRPRQ